MPYDEIMGFRDRITSVLAQAEKGVLELVAAAASAGDYESLDFARALAGRLRGLRENAGCEAPPEPRRSTQTQPNSRTDKPKAGSAKPSAKHPVDSAKRGAGYPKYAVSDGCLNKTAWSRKKHKEYTHRAPLATVVRILDHLKSVEDDLGTLTAEHCLSTAADQGEPFPSYKFYLVLGLLKQLNVARPIGREGFQLAEAWRSDADQYLGLNRKAEVKE